MNSRKSKKIASTFRLFVALLFLMTGSACSHEPQTITGKVVDESGAPLSDVKVVACYSGWGRSNGQLVWDKDYCSEAAQTDRDGSYVIHFKGPDSMRLRARKEGWVQTLSYNITHSRIVLASSEDHSARLKAAARQREQERRQRLPGESDADYYCRVIVPERRNVHLSYRDQPLVVMQTLLVQEARSEALFAVRGSSGGAQAFAGEAVIKVSGEATGSTLSLRPVETSCGADVHFIGVDGPDLDARADTRVEILVPSISAMFGMHAWSR